MLEISVGEALAKTFERYGPKAALDIGGREYSYHEVRRSVNKLANALLGLGLKKGDRVVIMTTNRIEYLYADFAAATAGLVKVPLNNMLTPQDVLYRIRDSEPAAVFLDGFFYDRMGLPLSCDVPVNVLIGKQGVSVPEGVLHFDQLIDKGSEEAPDVEVTPEDLLAIMYTGGTTGEPKGVMHTHKSCMSIFFSEIVELDIDPGEIMLQTAPLPHAAGFLIPPCLMRGGKVIVTERFDPSEFFHLVEEKRVTWTFMVPTMIYAILDHPARKEHDLSSLRTILYAAAPTSPARLEQALLEFGPVFLQGYSQMEVACQTTVFSKEHHLDALQSKNEGRLGSCGLPVYMAQVRCVDENQEAVPPDEVGELITRGPHMMKGYWRKEEETNRTVVNGWLHTGDLATIDEEGFIYIVDRKKDMIITGGMNVYSEEVENALSSHSAVAEVVVIGVPDPRWGEAVVAVVVLQKGVSANEEEFIDYCKGRISAYKVPKRIDIRPAIPKTPYGKHDKKSVRAEYWKDKDRKI